MNIEREIEGTSSEAASAGGRPWTLELEVENTASEVVRAAVADAWKRETGGELPPGLSEARAAEAQETATLLARQHARRHGGGPVVIHVKRATDGRIGLQLHDEVRSAVSAMVLPEAPAVSTAAPGAKTPRGSVGASAPATSAPATSKLQPADTVARKLAPPAAAAEPRKLKPAPGTQRS